MTDPKVLIVNEDAALFKRLQTHFKANAPAIEVLSAISGPRAIGIATSQQPDVIIVDGEMTGVDGYELTAAATRRPGLGRGPRHHPGREPVRGHRAQGAAVAAHRRTWPRASTRRRCSTRSWLCRTLPSRSVRRVPRPRAPVSSAGGYGRAQAPSAVAPPLRGVGVECRGERRRRGAARGLAAEQQRRRADAWTTCCGCMIERDGSDLHITVGSPPGHPPARRHHPVRGLQARCRPRTRRR